MPVSRPENAPDENHPFLLAARYTDAEAEEHGLEKVASNMGLDIADVIYIARQRALRMVMLQNGRGDELQEATRTGKPQNIKFTAAEEEQVLHLTSLYIDAFLIGWRANDYHRQS